MRLSSRALTMLFFVLSVMLFVFAFPRTFVRLLIIAAFAFGFHQVYKTGG